MTAGSSILAITSSAPLQRAQLSISIPNTRLNRCAQFIATCRGVGGWPSSAAATDRGGAPIPRPAGVSIHIFGGDFFHAPRIQWNAETQAEGPSDGAAIHSMFERDNERLGLEA
jgi:hypothetical protein